MWIEAGALGHKENYRLLSSVVLPRAIAWVSTRSADGVRNIAPFSFFTIATPTPPTLLFSAGRSDPQDLSQVKDTLRNIRETGEFVVNVVTEALAEPMNVTGAAFPPTVDEFVEAGLTAAPGNHLGAPLIAESPVSMECRFLREIAVGVSTLVLGQVVAYRLSEEVLSGDRVDPEKLQPLGRLGGSQYCRVRDLIRMPPFARPGGSTKEV